MDSTEKIAQKWSQSHYNTFTKYRGQWVAYNGTDGIIAHHTELKETAEQANATGKWYVLKYVNPYTYAGLRRMPPVRRTS